MPPPKELSLVKHTFSMNRKDLASNGALAISISTLTSSWEKPSEGIVSKNEQSSDAMLYNILQLCLCQLTAAPSSQERLQLLYEMIKSCANPSPCI
jgi:hypothetical protein